jgi:hypothetical protein
MNNFNFVSGFGQSYAHLFAGDTVSLVYFFQESRNFGASSPYLNMNPYSLYQGSSSFPLMRGTTLSVIKVSP